MESSGIKDTTAYSIIREMIDHLFNTDKDLENEDVLWICKAFQESGGSWERIVRGSTGDMTVLEKIIDIFLQSSSESLVLSSHGVHS